MSESALWKRVRSGVLGVVARADLSRVENMVEAGMPDVNFCVDGVEGWVELKHCNAIPKRAGTPLFGDEGLRDSQIVWIYKRVKRGGRVWIVAQADDILFIVHGKHARIFNEQTFDELVGLSEWWHKGGLS